MKFEMNKKRLVSTFDPYRFGYHTVIVNQIGSETVTQKNCAYLASLQMNDFTHAMIFESANV